MKKGCEQTGVGLILSLALAASPMVGCAAAPSVAQVLEVCARAAASGHQGVDTATCEWYAIPCACKVGRSDPEADRWCIPTGESTARTVRKVVAELRLVPDQQTPIDAVTPDILARLYSCGPAVAEGR